MMIAIEERPNLNENDLTGHFASGETFE